MQFFKQFILVFHYNIAKLNSNPHPQDISFIPNIRKIQNKEWRGSSYEKQHKNICISSVGSQTHFCTNQKHSSINFCRYSCLYGKQQKKKTHHNTML